MSERRTFVQSLKRYGTEFVVVFLGVWLSLLAEQWRQGRADADEERLALEAIASDVEADHGLEN